MANKSFEKNHAIRRKLGIISECLYGVPSAEALPLIKEAGFECYFTELYEYEDVCQLKAVGDRIGLTLEFIHAPFGNINSMWLSGMGYLDIYKKMITSIDTASALNVPAVIIHVSSGWKSPEINDLGLARYDSLVEYAIKKGVKIAFENLRKIGNLSYFADRYAGISEVGFCYDVGHEHCYTKYIRWMDVFRERMIATHIHDNFGRTDVEGDDDPDLHILPFDGNADYEHMMRDIDKYRFGGALILEVSNNSNARPDYLEMSHKEFLKTAYDRIKKISEM